MVLFSPLGPLDRDELDLITVPANSAMVDALLPNRLVAVGETWKLDTDWLAPLLGLDAVHRSTVVCKLDRVEKNLAIVHAREPSAVRRTGVSSEITLAAKYSFDTQLKRITWYAMTLKEKRAVGHAHPALEATARVQMAIEKAVQRADSAPERAGRPELKADEPARLLEFRSPSRRLRAAAGPPLARDDRAGGRERPADGGPGDLIAQSNISALPPLEKGETFSHRGFPAGREAGLGRPFRRIRHGLGIGHRQRPARHAGGHDRQDSELSIDWVYYHLTDDQGRRASCVFTYESELGRPIRGRATSRCSVRSGSSKKRPATSRMPPLGPCPSTLLRKRSPARSRRAGCHCGRHWTDWRDFRDVRSKLANASANRRMLDSRESR